MKENIRSLAAWVALPWLTVSTTGAPDAQVEPDIPSLDKVLTIHYSVRATGAPTIENGIFQVTAKGQATGDMAGTMTHRITTPVINKPAMPIASLFTLETEQGKLEGYLTGSVYVPAPDSDATMQCYGRVISVTGAYANLYLAEVYLNTTVSMENGMGTGDTGSIRIAPRY